MSAFPGVDVASRVTVVARDRRGKALALPEIRAAYDRATSSESERPALFLETRTRAGDPIGVAQATANVVIKKNTAALAALLRGLLEVSRQHKNLELRVETIGRSVAIARGLFDGDTPSLPDWAAIDAKREITAPAPGAERIGSLAPVMELMRGTSFALAYAGAVYLPDGPETVRRATPPGRFKPVAWSRDGKTLAVIGRAEGGESWIWISRAGSGVTAAHPSDAGDPTGAAFSPDGASIAVTTARGRLAILSADGSAASAIPVGKGLKLFDPAWSPDGAFVACVSEDGSRARTLHVVSAAEGKKGARLLGVDAPATDDQALADPEFDESGGAVLVRALWGAKGEQRTPRLLRVPLDQKPEVVGPPLCRVQLRGGISRWRGGSFFLAGIGAPDGDRLADAAWLTPEDLRGERVPVLSQAPKGAKLAFGAPDGTIVFLRRTKTSTRLWRDGKKVKLPFPAWLSMP